MTWNIHGGQGTDGRSDLGRIAALLEEMRCDVAALQEVGDPHKADRPATATIWQAEGRHQA